MKSIKNIDSVCRSNQYKTIGFWATKSIEKVSKIQGKINSTINTNTQKPPSKNHVLLLFLLSWSACSTCSRPLGKACQVKKNMFLCTCSRPLDKACQGETCNKTCSNTCMQQAFGQGLPGWNKRQLHTHFFTCGKPLGKACQGSPCNTNTLAGKATCASCPFGKDTIHQCCFWC